MNEKEASQEARIAGYLRTGNSLHDLKALTVFQMYALGTRLQPDSRCLVGDRAGCQKEMKHILADEATNQAIQLQASQMMASLKLD